MAKNQGYILLHKSLLDSSIWDSPGKYDLRSAWIDLLLRANYEDTEAMSRSGDVIIVRRGQLLTSQSKLAKRWGWSVSKVHRFCEKLKNANMLNFERLHWDHGATLMTILNYSYYQDSSHFVKSKKNSNENQRELEEKSNDAYLKEYKEYKRNKRKGEDPRWG